MSKAQEVDQKPTDRVAEKLREELWAPIKSWLKAMELIARWPDRWDELGGEMRPYLESWTLERGPLEERLWQGFQDFARALLMQPGLSGEELQAELTPAGREYYVTLCRCRQADRECGKLRL